MVSSGAAFDDAHVPANDDQYMKARTPISQLRLGSHEGQATVCTPADLGLVYIDEDSRMSQWPSTTVTGYNPRLCPSHGLLMNEIDGCFWLGLRGFHPSQRVPQPSAHLDSPDSCSKPT